MRDQMFVLQTEEECQLNEAKLKIIELQKLLQQHNIEPPKDQRETQSARQLNSIVKLS